ncbi:MAG: sensor histidine kinase [Paracoccus denitrificans]|uniref:Sensor histidine kinase n=1 Tax=Paracoccus denitrificans TaxID=266 RepID=A0A533I352_PARDE|nr:MAG: sensor histidine kinase [Paracoccus denitrificans]
MEVTHMYDHVTHAVVGGSEKLDFTVADGGFFMQMLSASLYKDQKLAVIRETLANADDAHKMVGQTRPFEVTLTAEKLIIRDFGPGIPHEKIGPVYTVYGGSTKTNDDGQTGGFGLGCKAPFAYTDNFQVTSYCNGMKTIYRMSKSDSEVGGKPSCIKIVSIPTQETGLEVSINIALKTDVHQFASRIEQVLANGEMNAIFNGNQAKVLPFSTMEKGYLITDASPLNSHERLYVRYGAVIYPIEDNDAYHYEWHSVHSTITQLGRRENGSFYLILQARPGSLSLTPSREGLTITDTTIETITKLLEDFKANYTGDYEREAKVVFRSAVQAAKDAGDFKLLMANPFDLSLQKKYIEKPVSGDVTYIVNPVTLARWALLHQYPGHQDHSFQLRDIKDRVGTLVQQNAAVTQDRGLLRSMLKAIRGAKPCHAGGWAFEEWKRRVVVPVLSKLRDNKLMDTNTLQFAIPYVGWSDERSYYRNDRIYLRNARHGYVDNLGKMMLMQKRLIILTHNAEDFEVKFKWADSEALENTPNAGALKAQGDSKFFGALVYQVGRAKAKVEEARRVLKGIKGYTVLDLTEYIEYREPKARTAPAAGKVKLAGYPTLNGISDGKFFDWQKMTTTEDRTMKPIGFVRVYGKSDWRGRKNLHGLGKHEQAQALAKAYGDVVTACITPAQVAKLLKEGIPGIKTWLPKQIIKDLTDPAMQAALPGTLRVVRRWVSQQDGVDTQFVITILQTKELRELFKLPELVQLTAEQANVLNLLKEVEDDFTELAESKEVEAFSQIVPGAKIQKFVKGLAANPMVSLIDTAAIRVIFDGTDEALKAKTVKLIKQVIKG